MHCHSKTGQECSGLKEKCCQQVRGGPSSPLSPAPEVLCPGLSSPGQKRDGTTGASLLWGQKDDWDTGASLLWGELGFFTPNKCRMERGVIISVCKHPMEGIETREPDSSQWCLVGGQEPVDTTWNPWRTQEILSLLGDAQTPAGDSHDQPFLADPTWADEVWRGPFHCKWIWDLGWNACVKLPPAARI